MTDDDAIQAERDASARCDELIAELVEAIEPIQQWGGDLPGDGIVGRLQRALIARYGAEEMQAVKRYRKAAIPGALRTEVYERDGYACVSCGVRRDLSVDHIVAESRGGLTCIENLQTMCRPCNSRKGVK